MMSNFYIQQQLRSIHSYLMYKKFPYHSVSVIYRAQDLYLHVIFMENVREMVTNEIKNHLKSNEFTYSFTS